MDLLLFRTMTVLKKLVANNNRILELPHNIFEMSVLEVCHTQWLHPPYLQINYQLSWFTGDLSTKQLFIGTSIWPLHFNPNIDALSHNTRFGLQPRVATVSSSFSQFSTQRLRAWIWNVDLRHNNLQTLGDWNFFNYSAVLSSLLLEGSWVKSLPPDLLGYVKSFLWIYLLITNHLRSIERYRCTPVSTRTQSGECSTQRSNHSKRPAPGYAWVSTAWKDQEIHSGFKIGLLDQ